MLKYVPLSKKPIFFAVILFVSLFVYNNMILITSIKHLLDLKRIVVNMEIKRGVPFRMIPDIHGHCVKECEIV